MDERKLPQMPRLNSEGEEAKIGGYSENDHQTNLSRP